jgi:hypothetical protein
MDSFSQEWNSLLDSVKSNFYSNQFNPNTSLPATINNLQFNQRSLFVSSLFQELNYEQEKRRLYILASIGIKEITRDESEILLRRLAQEGESSPEQLLPSISKSACIEAGGAINTEVKEQIRIFSTVAENIARYFAEKIASEKIAHLYTLLKRVSPEEKTDLQGKIDSFITDVDRSYGDRGLSNINVSRAVEENITKAGLGSIYSKYNTLIDRLVFLNLVSYVIAFQLANNGNLPVSDEKAIQSIALWEYYKSPTNTLFITNEDTASIT